MTTYVDARDLIVNHINSSFSADYPLLKVFYENTTEVDVNTVGSKYMRVGINFITAKQVSLELNPIDRTIGEVVFLFAYKEGEGTRDALGMFDYVRGLFSYKYLGGVNFRVPVPGSNRSRDGWMYFTISVPLFFDSTP